MVYFISGHRNITREEFNDYYIPEIDWAVRLDPNVKFVVGDCEGADEMAQNYIAIRYPKIPVTVFHIGDTPRYKASEKFSTTGKFNSDIERDACMTSRSDQDIAFVRDPDEDTGTRQNVVRRHTMKHLK